MTSRLKSLPSLKGTNVMAVLEGGYDLEATAKAAEATVRVVKLSHLDAVGRKDASARQSHFR